MASVKLYIDWVSQPARAVISLCKLARIQTDIVELRIFKGEHLTKEFEEINPDKKVPALVDGKFSLFESHSILRYLCNSRNVADHFYPKTDFKKRAVIDCYLDWHLTNTRQYCAKLVVKTKMPHLVQNENIDIKDIINQLEKVFKMFQEFWLKDGKFIGGNDQISIADLSAFCEIIQLSLMNFDFSKYPVILKWLDKISKIPEIQETHAVFYKILQNEKKQGKL